MNRNIPVTAALACIFLGLVIVFIKTDSLEKSTPQKQQNLQEVIIQPTVYDSKRFNLVAKNNSGEEGWVSFKEIDGKAIVNANVLTYPYPEDGQPGTIYSGSCNNLGTVRYQLETLFEGASETILPINKAELASQLPFAISIFKSTSEKNISIACVDITSLE